MPVSFMPETFVEGGGLWDNKDVRFGNCHFESEWDAGGQRTAKSPAFVADIEFIDDGETQEQGWSCGNGKDYQASKDGKKAADSGDYLVGAALRKSSNFVYLVNSLIEALPDDKKQEYMEKLLTGSASAWNGLEAHMVRQKVERPGLKAAVRADGKVFDQTVAVIDTILKFPWDKKAPPGAKAAAGAKATAGAKAGTKATTAAIDPAELTNKALMEIGKVLAAAGDEGISKTDMSEAVFKAVSEPKLRQKIVQLIFDNEWLSENAEAGGFEFDAETEMVTVAG